MENLVQKLDKREFFKLTNGKAFPSYTMSIDFEVKEVLVDLINNLKKIISRSLEIGDFYLRLDLFVLNITVDKNVSLNISSEFIIDGMIVQNSFIFMVNEVPILINLETKFNTELIELINLSLCSEKRF